MNVLPVMRPFLPPLEDVTRLMQRAWDSRWLTNDGPLAKELEAGFADLLDVPHALLVNNATIGLMVALKALNLPEGAEVITTPFTFVASTQAIAWCGLKVVFADIDPATGTLDPKCVEAAITADTGAILDVHVYGVPAHNAALKALAEAHGLMLMYDAAHALTTRVDGESVARWGDISVFSLHATKLIHSGEGGLITTTRDDIAAAVKRVRSYGMTGPETIVELGLNAKMSEVNAAVGLACLPYAKRVRDQRKARWEAYAKGLQGIAGLDLLHPREGVEHVYFYAPLKVDAGVFGMDREGLIKALAEARIGARRYFYPLTSEFPPFNALPSAAAAKLPVANAMSRQVLCLPLYHDLDFGDIERVCEVIRAQVRG